MAIDALSVFKDEYDLLEDAPTIIEGATNFSGWADARVTSKMSLPGLTGPGLTFTFGKAAYTSALSALTVNPIQAAAIALFAATWEIAMLASIASVAAGTSIGVPSNATTWSSITSTLIDVPSITLGKAKILELISVDPADETVLPDKIRAAFLELTITTTGLDSTPPTAGPILLVDVARAVA